MSIYDIYYLEKKEIPPAPIVAGGMVHRVWGQKGKMMGGDGKFSGNGTHSPAAHHFPPSTPSGAHHSAANGVSERNLQRNN
jgi:hypothetical protein